MILQIISLLILSAVYKLESIDYSVGKSRNQYLRLYVFQKKHKIHCFAITATNFVSEKAQKSYQFLLSKYYDANIFYYSLSDKERELIEQAINLTI